MSKKTKCLPPQFSKEYFDWNKVPLLMTMEETCCLLRVSDVTVKKYLDRGLLRGIKLGDWRIDRDSIRAILNPEIQKGTVI